MRESIRDNRVLGVLVVLGLVYGCGDDSILNPDPPEPGKDLTVTLPGGTKLELVWIEPGTFMMGASEGDPDARDEERPRREVTISEGFHIGRYEITRGQWLSVSDNPLPALDKESEALPVYGISWDQANTFITDLNSALSPLTFRLPTEAEWEYSCRAGTTSRYSVSFDTLAELEEHMWVAHNSEGIAHGVGSKRPNPWGLNDMHGNVSEWVRDWFGPYEGLETIDPERTEPMLESDGHVYRGGSFSTSFFNSKSSSRFRGGTSNPVNVGLRVIYKSN